MTVEVRYLGHLGNNLFQYALGRILAEELGSALTCRAPSDTRGWGAVEAMSGIVDRFVTQSAAFADAPQSLPGNEVDDPQLRYVIGEKQNWSGHGINLPYLLRHGHGHRIVLHGYFQRAEYYLPYRERIARWLALPPAPLLPRLGKHDVLVHLRQSLDMKLLDRQIDLRFYTDTLADMAPARVYVCGLGIDDAVRAALAPFNPQYLHLPALDTLKVIMQARRIVLANSTFSWWGAWLSEAEEIVYPRVTRNFWSADRADIALEVPDARYRYVDDVVVSNWQPFEVAASVEWQFDGGADASPASLRVRKEQHGLSMQLSADLAPLAAWLTTRRAPFGFNDIEVCELSPAARQDAPRLLLALARHGFLDADQTALDGIAAIYGEVTAGA
ncbi:MAG: hypothetical protein IT492_04230 [Gammaproteobacteria bacterium]|nr:hypothetical protein [Gammaproteobacteria bacterium]